MALFNEVLVPRWNSILQKITAIKLGAPSPQLSPDVQAVIALEEDRPEWLFLGGSRLWAGFTTAQAVALKRSIVQLLNPSGSGCLVIVNHVAAWLSDAAGIVQLSENAPNYVAQANGSHFVLDTRDGADPAATLTEDNQHAAGGVNILANFTCISVQAARSFHEWTGVIVLKPGAALFVLGNADNVELDVSARGYERTLEPSETR